MATLVSHVIEVKAALASQLDIAAEVIRGKMESHAKKDYLTPLVYDAPETWYVRTGLLRNATLAKTAKDGDEIQIIVGTNVKYAKYVELGTGVFAEDGKGRKTPWGYRGSDGELHFTRGMAPRPFLRPSVENHVDEYKEVVKKALEGN